MAYNVASVGAERDGSGKLLGSRFLFQNILDYDLYCQRSGQIIEPVKLKFGGRNIKSKEGVIGVSGSDQASFQGAGRGLRGSAGFDTQQGKWKTRVVLNLEAKGKRGLGILRLHLTPILPADNPEVVLIQSTQAHLPRSAFQK